MSRNRYTSLIHEEQRALIARREKELVALARELHRTIAEPAVAPVTDNGKRHRRARIEQRRRHKPIRPVAAPRSHQVGASPTEGAHTPSTIRVAIDRDQSELVRTVGRLARLLQEAAPLVKRLDSASTPPIYRQALHMLASSDQYAAFTVGLVNMTSPELWDTAHAKEFVSPDLAQRLTALGVPVSEHAVRP